MFGPRGFTDRVVTSFRNYFTTREKPFHGVSLQHCIREWLVDGDAVKLTRSNYTRYLQAVLIIIAAYEVDPSIISTPGRESRWPAQPPHRVLTLYGGYAEEFNHLGGRAFDETYYRNVVKGRILSDRKLNELARQNP